MQRISRFLYVIGLVLTGSVQAAAIDSGQTSVALDVGLLTSVGLTLSGVDGPVVDPGSLPGSVAFPINGRSAQAPALPTTFTYTPGTLAPFAGTIEHSGSVLFNADALEVGNFTIGYDPLRAAGAASGFFVADNITFPGVALFDVGVPDALTATPNALIVAADLLVSPELAGILENAALAGVDVGDALVEAQARAVGEPQSLLLLALVVSGLLGASLRRKR